MLSDKERIAIAEKQIQELLAAKKIIEEEKKLEEDIIRFMKKQEKGFFKYVLEIFKLIVILSVVLAGGNKALDTPWITALIK